MAVAAAGITVGCVGPRGGGGSGGAGELEDSAEGDPAVGVRPGLQLAASTAAEREVLAGDLHPDLDDRSVPTRWTVHPSLPALVWPFAIGSRAGNLERSGDDLHDGEEVETRVQEDGLGQVAGAEGPGAGEQPEEEQ